ncbi:Spy/CpxP family protein refolding chaperone [Winogradskyella sp.]|uniref:Spy/CpxP family protein refolding chaperone n=1 Tax=Winogradskyella sp. TaxID=1883156 RepID=UPI00262302F4|nr:Spy/CpxP family protein refolding chaperone [Winogradskyella sp.]
MKKQLPLYILLVFLIAVNGFFLYKFLGDSKENDLRGPKGPNSFITNRLNFNDTQLKEFNDLEQVHRKKMMSISEQIRATKDVLFDNISKAGVDTSLIDSITSVIGNYEKEKDMEIFRHFRAIYEICDESQKAKFNRLVKDALHRRPPPKGKRPPDGMGRDRHGPPPRH